MMKQLYETNRDFKEYVDRYCKSKRHNKSVDDALKDLVVKQYADYLLGKSKKGATE